MWLFGPKQMAVDEINAAGGVNGRMIELIVEDSKCNAQDSITAHRKLTDVDGVKIILGPSCSGSMLGEGVLNIVDRAYVLENGRVVHNGTPQSVLDTDILTQVFLGRVESGPS